MKRAFRSALIITIFTFSTQLVLFIGQIIAAAKFGAGSEMDAFLAASTLPQYVITVLLGSLGFVFIPYFIDRKTNGNQEQAYKLAANLFNNSIFFLGLITIMGIVFARPFMMMTAPGLSPQSLDLGVKVSIITWPTVLATGALSLLLSIYQAEKKFSWQAIVPFIGAVIHLILLILLIPSLGVIGLAFASTCGVIVQVILLLRVLIRHDKYQFRLDWGDAEFHQILKLVAPLVLVAIVTKFTPLIDRFLASGLPEGSISHLNYAFKVATVASLLISVGGSTVIFPKIASDVSTFNTNALKGTISFGLRFMWVIIAPVITIGISLSLPMINILFNRGEFTGSDSIVVADLLKIYIVALIGMCLGTVTSKAYYALKDTRTLAVFGIIEAVAYAIYTVYLMKWLGVIGIAIGYMIYFNISLLWQLLILRFKLGNSGGYTLTRSYAITLVAAVVGGGVAYIVVKIASISLVQVAVGGFLGLLSYAMVLFLLNSREFKLIKEMILSGLNNQK